MPKSCDFWTFYCLESCFLSLTSKRFVFTSNPLSGQRTYSIRGVLGVHEFENLHQLCFLHPRKHANRRRHKEDLGRAPRAEAAKREREGPETEPSGDSCAPSFYQFSQQTFNLVRNFSPHGCGQCWEMCSQQGRCQDGFMRGVSCLTNHPEYFIYIKKLVDKTEAVAYNLPRLARCVWYGTGQRIYLWAH